MRRIVVGLDFSDGSVVALRWAASMARSHAAPMRIVSAWEYPWWCFFPDAPTAGPVASADEVRAVLEQQLADLVVAEGLADINVDVVIEHGDAAQVLVVGREPDDLLVVGSRGHNAGASGLLGSVSVKATAAASCPIALVSHSASVERTDGLSRVAVAVDGSANSYDALDWAIAHAATPADLLVVAVWRPRPAHIGLAEAELLAQYDCAKAHRAAANAANHLARAGRRCRIVVQEGEPNEILRAVAAEVGLLVMGARGEQHERELVLGAVAANVARHPEGVTIIVPPRVAR